MPRNTIDCPDITIQNGQQFSNAVLSDIINGDSDDIIIMSQAIDVNKSYIIQVNEKKDGTGTWYNLNDGANDVAFPNIINKAIIYILLNETFRIAASSAVGQLCTFRMKKRYSMGTGIGG